MYTKGGGRGEEGGGYACVTEIIPNCYVVVCTQRGREGGEGGGMHV